MAIILTTPVGRIVQGQLWKGRPVTDTKTKQPKFNVDDTPQMSWFFAIAIAKQPGHTHWAQTEWGAQIYAEGQRAHPQFFQSPTFSWKIEDGDSQIPNKKGIKNCDREGHRGHWIIKFSSNFAITKTYNANGTEAMPPEAFKPGHYVQVNASIKGNTGDSPGVYVNPNMVALSGYGTEIAFGPDVEEAGFGAAPLPVGASAAPIAQALLMPAISAQPAVPSLPGLPALPVAPSPVGFPMPGVASVAPGHFPPIANVPVASATPVTLPMTYPSNPVPVMPNPAILAVRQMTPAAGAFTYEQYIAAGHTDATLRAQGLMV